jgi:hypothetical protein
MIAARLSSPWTYNIGIPHVDVGWATFWLAVLGLIVASVAAIYAKRAFKAAEDDLTISKSNWEMAKREPKLAVDFEIGVSHAVSTQSAV